MQLPTGSMDRFANAEICGASTQVAGHSGIDVGIGWIGFPCEECDGLHDLSRLTIAALWKLFRNPCSLDAIQIPSFRQAFNGCDLFISDRAERRLTRAYSFSIQVYSAGTTQAYAATILCSGQIEHVAENPKKRSRGGNT